MNEEIESAVKVLASRITNKMDSTEAMKATQAVLNLAHALATLNQMKERSDHG